MGCGTSKQHPVEPTVASPVRQEPKVRHFVSPTNKKFKYNSWTLERSNEPVEDKQVQKTTTDDKDPSNPAMENVSFTEKLSLLLRAEDPENIGFVPYNTLEKALLATTQVSTPAFLRILAEAEQNGRGMVYYEAFVKRAGKVHERITNSELSPKTSGSVIRQLDEEMIVSILQKNIKEATSDWLTPPTNTLTRYNLRRLLETCDLGLTAKEINVILCKVTEDPPGSGTINTDEAIVQTCTAVLNLEPFILFENMRTVEEWKSFMRPQFIKRDKGPSGFLENYTIREILSAADLGLTPLQVVKLLTYAIIDDSGKIMYEECLEVLAQKFAAIFNETKARERVSKLLPKTEKYRDFTTESFTQVLGDALSNVSTNGEITRANLIATVLSVINPTPQELNSVRVITPFEVVDYRHMIPAIWEAFLFLNRTESLE